MGSMAYTGGISLLLFQNIHEVRVQTSYFVLLVVNYDWFYYC